MNRRYYDLRVSIPNNTDIETFVEDINKLFTLDVHEIDEVTLDEG